MLWRELSHKGCLVVSCCWHAPYVQSQEKTGRTIVMFSLWLQFSAPWPCFCHLGMLQERRLDGTGPVCAGSLFQQQWYHVGQMVIPLSLQCTFPNHLPAASNMLSWPTYPLLKLLWSEWVKQRVVSAHGTLEATHMDKDFFSLMCLSCCIHWLVILLWKIYIY